MRGDWAARVEGEGTRTLHGIGATPNARGSALGSALRDVATVRYDHDHLTEFALASPPRLDAERRTLRIELTVPSEGLLRRKWLTFSAEGGLKMELEWEPDADRDVWVTTSLALSRNAVIESGPAAAEWRERIVTLTRSDRGFERIDQGELVTLAWPASLGRVVVRLRPPPGSG